MHLLRACLLSSALSALPAAVVLSDSTGPAEDRRLLRCYDFEETINGRYVGEFERLPMDWYAIGRTAGVGDVNFTRVPLHKQLVETPGYASWTQVRYDDRHSSSGCYSLYLGLDGGSAGAFLRVGSLPAVPGSDYVITAAVRTTPLRHASVRLSASFVDGEGRRVPDSMVTSEPLRSMERWRRPVLALSGDHPRAAWIALQVELVQDAHHADAIDEKSQIVYTQVRGGAWVDDITIWQVPRAAVRTQSPVNIVRAPQRPQLTTHIRDLSGQTVSVRLDVHDYAGTLVASTVQPIGGGSPPPRPWTPNLPRFGWYLIQLTVFDREPPSANGANAISGSALTAILWLPDEPEIDPAKLHPFMLTAEGAGREQLALIDNLIEQSRLKSVAISAWEADTTASNLVDRRDLLDSILERVWAQGGSVALSLSPVPDELRLDFDVDPWDALGMLSQPRQRWEPLLNPLVMRYGQRVRQWRLGSTRSPVAVHTPARIEACHEARRHVGRLLPAPQIILPMQLAQLPVPELAGVVHAALDVPASVQAEWIGTYAAPWSSTPFTMHLQTPPATALPQPRRCADLALRMVHAWECGASGLSLSSPWTQNDGRETLLVPDPLLGVFSTVAHRLAGRRAAGRLPVGAGLRCILFDSWSSTEPAVLVAWNKSAESERSFVEMDLGGDPHAVDVFGNRTPLPRGPRGHRFTLSGTPVLIEGVDRHLALFRASFAVEPGFVESRQSLRPHRIWLTNPWPRPISGTMRIIAPPGWIFEPQSRSFTMSEGETLTVPLKMSFPASEVAGHKTLTARVNVQDEQPYTVDLTAPLVLGLAELAMDATVDVELNPITDQQDVVVTQVIANMGSQTMVLYAFCSVAGFGRQEVMIPRLEPAARVSRRFRFPGGGAGVRTAPVRVGLREEAGPAVLNKVITVEGL